MVQKHYAAIVPILAIFPLRMSERGKGTKLQPAVSSLPILQTISRKVQTTLILYVTGFGLL